MRRARRRFDWLILASLVGPAACGGGLPAGGASGGTGGAGGAPANDDCLPNVTAAELASTPRADTNLELLALRVGKGRLVADQAIYDRIGRDVGAIRAQRPDLATISFFPRYDGVTIPLMVDLATADQMKAGSYTAWDCLNRRLGAVMPFEYTQIGNTGPIFVSGKVKGIYALDVLAPEYQRLPGVVGGDETTVGGDGPTICVTPGPDTWHYVFDAASGDCLAGCIDYAYSHFTTDAAGALTPLEQWSSQGGGAAPAWVMQYGSQTVCRLIPG